MTPFNDLTEFIAVPRLDGLVLSPDGTRLITTVQQPDPAGAKYLRALWEIDPRGERPARRLTRSATGESAPAFRADGSLLFTSSRPDPDTTGEDESTLLWSLPPSGEAEVIARSPGGCSGPVAAGNVDVFAITTDRLPGADSAEEDQRRRSERKDRKIGAMLHEGFPIRYWDHELGPGYPRILIGVEMRDITPDAGASLVNAGYAVAPDGRTVVADWRVPLRHGQHQGTLVAIDVSTGHRRTIAAEDGASHGGPVISPDGRLVAAFRETEGDYETPWTLTVVIHAIDGTAPIRSVEIGDDLSPNELAWA